MSGVAEQRRRRVVSDQAREAPIFFKTSMPHVDAEVRLGWTRTSDDFWLRHAVWRKQAQNFRGTILLLQGRTEIIEKYVEVVEWLTMMGFDVVAFDWRGQGASTRHCANPRKGYVESIEEYGLDIRAIVSDVLLPDCRGPYYVIAHSTGALAGLYNIDVLHRQFERLVFVSPFFEFGKLPVPRIFLRRLTSLLVATGLGQLYIAGGNRPELKYRFPEDSMTSDRERFNRNISLAKQTKEIGIGGPTVAWIRAVMKAHEAINDTDFAASIRTPSLFVTGSLDQVISVRAVEEMTAKIRMATHITLPHAKHEIMQEATATQERFYAAIDAFFPNID